MSQPPVITITDNAAKRVLHLLKSRDKPCAGMKVGVKTGGCSGLSYEVDFADDIPKNADVIAYPDAKTCDSDNGFKIFIEPTAIMYLLGTEMDFEEEKLKSGFVFKNPNETGRCGCGESFSV